MADEEVLQVLRKGASVWNKWCQERTLSSAELFGSSALPHEYYWADLSGADLGAFALPCAQLIGVNLRGANLRGANLANARLQRSDLSETNLRMAELPQAKAIDCYLSRADLTGADLTGADLQGADLRGAMLKHTKLEAANLTGALFGDTVIADVDLGNTNGLWSIRHHAPSSIGVDTILRSRSQPKISAGFLQKFRIPEHFAKQLASSENGGQTYHSIFISYSSHDQVFVWELYNNLEQAGLKELFMAVSDVRTGELFADSIADSIKSHDKLLVILSAASLSSTWVAQEVRIAMEMETAGNRVIFPIRIDDAVLTAQHDWARSLRDTRHIADFSNWQITASYEKSLAKLLADLKKVWPG